MCHGSDDPHPEPSKSLGEIAEELFRLREMALDAGYPFLSYLIGMALHEAISIEIREEGD